MKLSKSKKITKIAVLSSFFVATSAAALGLSLSSCANPSITNTPADNARSFSSLFNKITPTIASSLTTSSGQSAILNTYVNKLLDNWYSVVNNTSIEIKNKDWTEKAEKSYKDSYDDYSKNKGKDWRQLFQQDVLDKVGGTEEEFLFDSKKNQFKTTLVENLFGSTAKNYLAYSSDNTNFIAANTLNKNNLNNIDNKYVNAKEIGEKNGFSFNAKIISSNELQRIDYGYADLMEFIMDSWIRNEMPLPLSMSLWKNSEDLFTMNQLFSNYFSQFENNKPTEEEKPEGDTEGSSRTRATEDKKFIPSYGFQFFDEISTNPSTISTTDKFNKLITSLYKGAYVDSTTGLIKLPKDLTEDSSTSLITNVNGLFDGTYVTPFTTAAWYKLSNYVFGINDEKVTVSEKVNSKFIMDNFLLYKQGTQGVLNSVSNNDEFFKFPYELEWTNNNTQTKQSVFSGKYKDVIGVKDFVNFSNTTKLTTESNPTANANSKLGQFIMVRNQFGVHLIGIDRIDILKQAYNKNSVNSVVDSFQVKFDRVLNEIRNTFMYYMACDDLLSEKTYNIQDSLKKHFEDNFESIIFKYVKQFIDNPDANKNNLFGPYVTQAPSEDSTINYTDNFGFELNNNSKSFQNYVDKLNEIKNGTQLRFIIESALDYKYAIKANQLTNTINSQVYKNQEKFNDNKNPKTWLTNGLSGVLPFKRNTTNGEFTSLVDLINKIVVAYYKPVTNNSQTNSSGLSITNDEKINVTNTYTNLRQAKQNYHKSIINFLDDANLVNINSTSNKFIGRPTYIFTNNDYINHVLLSIGAEGLKNIINSFYKQSYINPSFNIKGQLPGDVNVEGTSAWIENQINKSLQETYVMKEFTNNVNNIYQNGDWYTQDELVNKATDFVKNKWNDNEFAFTLNNLGKIEQFKSYSNYSDTTNLYDMLSTLRYVFDYDKETQKFKINHLYNFLDRATKIDSFNRSRAMVGWINQDSITKNTSFGKVITDNENALSIEEIKEKVSEDSKFKNSPALLLNTNSYSWFGAKNPYDSANNRNLVNTYTTDSNYWMSAPIAKENNTTTAINNMGFVGFQFESTDQTSGITTKLPTDIFNSSFYSNISDKQTNLQFKGMFYNFETREKIVNYVNNLSTPYFLTQFYNNNLKNSGLPIKPEVKEEIDKIIELEETAENRFKDLQKAIVNVVSDSKQVPDIVFSKMDGLPFWTNNADGTSSTLFNTSDDTSALKNQYIATQFNNSDVQNLVTKNNNQIITLNSGVNSYLGLNPRTFFNAVLMLVNDSTYLADSAKTMMFNVVGAISIYDIRLMDVIDKNYISNYNDWKKIQDLNKK